MSLEADTFDVVLEETFFAPVTSDIFATLVGQYQHMRTRIEQLADLIAGETGAAVPYFLEGNVENSGRWAPSVSALFDRKGAIAALNSTYWSKALALTDVLDLMPQKRRNEWHETIREQKCPEFEEETVRNTLMDLLNMRQQFLAERVADLAEIGPDHQCLEPSAGMGGLADFMPKDRTTCVEISGLHRKVLESKGFRVVWGDFLPWADGRVSEGKAFDRIVTNPPFDQGRWAAHIDHAAPLLRPGDRLVAILPSGAKNRDVLPGFRKEWHGPFDNQFPGASVSVVVLVADKDEA